VLLGIPVAVSHLGGAFACGLPDQRVLFRLLPVAEPLVSASISTTTTNRTARAPRAWATLSAGAPLTLNSCGAASATATPTSPITRWKETTTTKAVPTSSP